MAADEPDSDPESEKSTAPAPRPRPIGKLRGTIPIWQQIFFGALCLMMVVGIWAALTWGEVSEERILSKAKLPSPMEVAEKLPELFKDRNVDANTAISLWRVLKGFGLATIVGVPLGILAGCFPRVSAFLQPLSLFGRNAPMAALIPLTFVLFGGDEFQKMMFIFLAAVAFIMADSSRAVSDVAERYIDTAYTLGASRWQTIFKVLVPLSMPHIFNSLRLLFGLAFGYIMLVEVVVSNPELGGVGAIINIARRRGISEYVYLILIIIPIVAFVIDRIFYFIQTQLFPYRYGGAGYLAKALNAISYSLKSMWETAFPSRYEDRFQLALDELKNSKSASNS